MINLSGLVVGTMLSSGSGAGEGQWRIAIDDLPNTRVIPPRDYVGPMAVIAELGSGNDQAIVRTPVRLIWQPSAAGSTEVVGLQQLAPPPEEIIAPKQAVDEQLVAREKDFTQARSRLKARRHSSGTTRANSFKNQSLANKRRHRIPILDPELQTNVDPRRQRLPSLNYDSYANANSPRERRPLWNNDLQTIIDGSWERCERRASCSRETRR